MGILLGTRSRLSDFFLRKLRCDTNLASLL